MERFSKGKNEKISDRMYRLMLGEVMCCACDAWHPRTNYQTVNNGGSKWYCGCCGALIRPARRQWSRELPLFLFLLVLTLPFIIRVPNWVAHWTANDYIQNVSLVSLIVWPIFCGTTTVCLCARFGRALTSQLVEPHGRCLQCDYDLNYAVSERCPECGASAVHVLDAIGKKNRRGALARHE